MSFDYQVILDRIHERWMLATTFQRTLATGSLFLAFAFFLLFWTPLGNRRTVMKCMILALFVHLLAWGYVAEIVPPGNPNRTLTENRVKISLANPTPAGANNRPKLPETKSLSAGKRSTLLDPPPPREKRPEAPKLQQEITPPAVNLERPNIESKAEPIKEPGLTTSRPIDLSPFEVTDTPNPEATRPSTPPPAAKKQAIERPTLERAVRPQGTLPATRSDNPPSNLASELNVPPAKLVGTVKQPESRDLASAIPSGRSGTDFSLPPIDGADIEPPPPAAKKDNGAAMGNSGGGGGNGKGDGGGNGNGNGAGGDGSGDGSGTAMGKGSGKGTGGSPIGPISPKAKENYGDRFSENRIKKVEERGGSVETEKAVAAALVWLAAHQSSDGKWDADNFSAMCPDGDSCTGSATEKGSDTGVTGLALLAFLGAGNTHLTGKHQLTVRRGLEWLIDRQEQDSNLMGQGYLYSHAMATLALCEAYGMTNDKRIEKPAQRAINWLVAAQHENGGWRYRANEPGDLSVHGWVVLSMRSATLAGLKIPKSCLDRAKGFVEQVTTGPSKGLGCYQQGFPPSHPMTAEALVCRQVLGIPRTDPAMDVAADYLLGKLPGNEDYHIYYWYYGTLGMYQMGDKYWERWNARLTSTLLSAQEKSGHRAGSWAPQSPFGTDGGRIFSTAASAMCLEAYYRYLPIYRKPGQNAEPARKVADDHDSNQSAPAGADRR